MHSRPNRQWKIGTVENCRHHWYLLIWIVYFVLFYIAEHVVTDHYWVSYLPLDDKIPFCRYFIIPYCMWHPLLFAMTLIQVPTMILQFFSGSGFATWWEKYMSSSAAVPVPYYLVYFVLIIAFGYFYSSITFNPVEKSKNLQQNGGFIPGIRPGKPTGEYLGKISNRLTLFGSLYLAIIAIIPTVILNSLHVTSMFGATSVLIMVSVAMETTEQLEAQMLMRHYKGFLN